MKVLQSLLLIALLLTLVGCNKSERNLEIESRVYELHQGEVQIVHTVKKKDEYGDTYEDGWKEEYEITSINSEPTKFKDVWSIKLRYKKNGKVRERVEEWSLCDESQDRSLGRAAYLGVKHIRDVSDKVVTDEIDDEE